MTDYKQIFPSLLKEFSQWQNDFDQKVAVQNHASKKSWTQPFSLQEKRRASPPLIKTLPFTWVLLLDFLLNRWCNQKFVELQVEGDWLFVINKLFRMENKPIWWQRHREKETLEKTQGNKKRKARGSLSQLACCYAVLELECFNTFTQP